MTTALTKESMGWAADYRQALGTGAALCVAGAYLPSWLDYGGQLWAIPAYRFFPLLLVGVGWAMWRMSPSNVASGDRPWSWVLIVAAWAMLAVAIYSGASELAAASSLILLLALWRRWAGTPVVRDIWHTWLLLWIVIRLPQGLEQNLFDSVHRNTIAWAHEALDALGVLHVVDAEVIRTPAGRVLSAEAAYGASWALAAVAASGWYCCIRGRRLTQTSIVVAATLGWLSAVLVAREIAAAWLIEGTGVDMNRPEIRWGIDAVWIGLLAGLVAMLDSLLALWSVSQRPRRRRTTVLPDEAKRPTIGVVLTEAGNLEPVVAPPPVSTETVVGAIAASYGVLGAWQAAMWLAGRQVWSP